MNLASTLDKVYDDHKPVLITRQKGKPAVLISLEDFQSYEETAYFSTTKYLDMYQYTIYTSNVYAVVETKGTHIGAMDMMIAVHSTKYKCCISNE